MAATLFDVAAIADPGLRRSEAICLELGHVVDSHDVHPSVVITAVATLLTVLLADSPPQHRARMIESVLDDIRRNVLEPDADHAA